MSEIWTWLDLDGRYRITSFPYDDPTRPLNESDEEFRQRCWVKSVAVKPWGISVDHPRFRWDGRAFSQREAECGGLYFRRPVFSDANGNRDPINGAWEMDTDGGPKVNMPKARLIHMDHIRRVRNEELVKEDVTFMRAVEAGDTSAQAAVATKKQTLRDIPATFDITTDVDTPEKLKAKWPSELPARE